MFTLSKKIKRIAILSIIPSAKLYLILMSGIATTKRYSKLNFGAAYFKSK